MPRLCQQELLSLLLIAAMLLAGCGAESPKEMDADSKRPSPIRVSVAASTKEVMEAIAAKFDQEKDATTKINPGPSSGLASQILEGAPVDLFLSANREFAKKIEEAGLAAESKELLTNKLVLVVPQGNPAKVNGPEDLLSERVKKVALAGEKVPAGKYADQALTKLKLLEPLTAAGKIARGQDVRNALQFVERGEAEAGIVYSTDVQSESAEVVYKFDSSLHDEIVYVLVLLKEGEKNSAAKAFFEYAQSKVAEEVFLKAGFLRVSASK